MLVIASVPSETRSRDRRGREFAPRNPDVELPGASAQRDAASAKNS
jgi:hypothetical protein